MRCAFAARSGPTSDLRTPQAASGKRKGRIVSATRKNRWIIDAEPRCPPMPGVFTRSARFLDHSQPHDEDTH